MIDSISVAELKKYNNLNIIDIRSIEKFNSKHIPGAINISFEQLLINHNKYMNNKDTYYIYCQKGIQSRRLCSVLKNMGYKVVNISGGYEAWVLNE